MTPPSDLFAPGYRPRFPPSLDAESTLAGTIPNKSTPESGYPFKLADVWERGLLTMKSRERSHEEIEGKREGRPVDEAALNPCGTPQFAIHLPH
jgi:hypothetical protein